MPETTALELTNRITTYRDATRAFLDLAGSLTGAELDNRLDAESWTPRMVIHHMADSETNSYVRLRRLLAGPDGTQLQGYDENLWATALHYDRPAETSLAVVAAVRASSAELLECFGSDVDVLEREGLHSESGRYTIADWIRTYTAHALDHAEQIRAQLA